MPAPRKVEVSKKDQTAIERITFGPSREREVLAVAYDRLQEVSRSVTPLSERIGYEPGEYRRQGDGAAQR